MSMPNIAEYDQMLADANTKFEVLGETMRILRDDRGKGEMQAVADCAAMLMTWDPSEVVSALLAAVVLKSREVLR